PEAPAEYRGGSKPVHTTGPGILCGEHRPKTARLAHQVALVRSLPMSGRVIGDGDHHADTYYMLTGRRPDRSFFVEGINRKPHADDWPFVGSTVAWRRPATADLPGIVQLPARSGEITGYINPGQFSGLLGPQYEPVMVRGDLDKPHDLAAPQFALPGELADARIERRRDLLGQLEGWQRRLEGAGQPVDRFTVHQRQAFTLLT